MIFRIGAIVFLTTLLLAKGLAAQSTNLHQSVTENKMASQGGDGLPTISSLELIALGEKMYERRCTACHSLDQNRVGPKHRGVYWRKAGSVEGFRYSRALSELDVVWTEETLDPWLENPPDFAPGTAMGFRLKNPEERQAIIAYLKSLSND